MLAFLSLRGWGGDLVEVCLDVCAWFYLGWGGFWFVGLNCWFGIRFVRCGYLWCLVGGWLVIFCLRVTDFVVVDGMLLLNVLGVNCWLGLVGVSYLFRFA